MGMSINLTIGKVTRVDEEIVNGLNGLLPQLSSSAKPLTEMQVLQIIDGGNANLFVCRRERDIVGSITLIVCEIPTGVRAFIEDVVVDEKERGKKIGQALIEHALDYARRKGAKTVDLTSRPERVAANRLYIKAGFQIRNTNVYRYRLED